MISAWHAKRYHILAALTVFAVSAAFYLRHRENDTMPAHTKELPANCEFATLGGGCFWCLEAAFEQVQGVERVESGYAGGQTRNPTYDQVCSGGTGHAEVVQIAFDPKVISYRDLLEIFFAIHDPTTLNRQGNDVGTQYRSVIFYHSAAQKETAEKLIAELQPDSPRPGGGEGLGVRGVRPIVTQVEALDVFYRAEDYHQGYFRANPSRSYCQAVVAPKVAKVRKNFAAKLKPAS